MGMILTPKSGCSGCTLEQLIQECLQAGIRVKIDRDAGKRFVIQTIVLMYCHLADNVDDDDYQWTRKFDLSRFDSYLINYEKYAEVCFSDPSTGHEIKDTIADTTRFWFAECFPGDDDDNTRLVTKLAKALDYQIEGE